MRQPFSLTYGIPLSAGPVSQLQTLKKKMKHAGEKEREQIVLPVLFFWNQSLMVSAQGPNHSKLKQVLLEHVAPRPGPA